MQCSITEIRFTSPGGKVNVYLFCKPQYILEASPAGLVAKGLWGNFTPHPPTNPPHIPPSLIPPNTHTHTHTPLQIAWVYVPACPVNFLSSCTQICWLLVASVGFWELSCPCKCTLDLNLWLLTVCLGVGSHRKYPPTVSVDNAEGRTDIRDKWKPKCVTGDRVVVNKSTTLGSRTLENAVLQLIASLHNDHVNCYDHACGFEKLHGLKMMQHSATNSLSYTRWMPVFVCLPILVSGGDVAHAVL